MGALEQRVTRLQKHLPKASPGLASVTYWNNFFHFIKLSSYENPVPGIQIYKQWREMYLRSRPKTTRLNEGRLRSAPNLAICIINSGFQVMNER